MRHALQRPGLARFALVFSLCGCGQPASGALTFAITAPSDPVLSPLADPRVTTLEVRDTADVVLGQTRYPAADPQARQLSLGSLPVGQARDLRILALGPGGLQALGLAVTRNVTIQFGQTTTVQFDLRRPLFFFGGRALIPGLLSPSGPALSPGRYLAASLSDPTLLRVVDPNAGMPLLAGNDLRLDASGASSPPVLAAAGTGDGKSLLAATSQGRLHVIDSLQLKDAGSVSLSGAPAQAMSVGPRDGQLVILHYDPVSGARGRISFVADLPAFRASPSPNSVFSADIDAGLLSTYGPPLAAAFTPDGASVDVVLGRPLLGSGQTDCSVLGEGTSRLLRFDVKSGAAAGTGSAIAYTTGIVYTAAGVRVLAQPCASAGGGHRLGRVVLTQGGTDQLLYAPGTADLSLIENGRTLVALGRDDAADSPGSAAQGSTRILTAGAKDWSQLGAFDLPNWQVPSLVSSQGNMPLPSSVNLVFGPRDVSVYRVVSTPDRSHALMAIRVLHTEKSMLEESFPGYTAADPKSRPFNCMIDISAYTYHLMLVNLQTGAREQDFPVGMQMLSCTSRLYDTHNFPNLEQWQFFYEGCWRECRYFDDMTGKTTDGYLLQYQQGFVPAAGSALFSGQ